MTNFQPTRGYLAAWVRNFLEDANIGRTWKNWQVNWAVNASLQVCQNDVVHLSKGHFVAVAGMSLIEGQERYSLPTEAMRIMNVEYIESEDNHPIPLIRIQPNQRALFTPDATGTPRYYYLKGNNQIGLLPVPDTDVNYVSDDAGPIRITYVERINNFVTLDAPNYTRFQAAAHDGTAEPCFHQFMVQQPKLSFDLTRLTGDLTGMPGCWTRVFPVFVKVDRDKGKWGAVEQIGMPGHGQWALSEAGIERDNDSQTIVIDDWPTYNTDDDLNEWPEDATHMDIWAEVEFGADSGLSPNINFAGNGSMAEMYWITRLTRDQVPSGGAITVDKQQQIDAGPLGPGDTGGCIFAGYTVNPNTHGTVGVAQPNTELVDTTTSLEALEDLFISQIPPTPHLQPERFPQDRDQADLVTGTAFFHNTIQAKGDRNPLHEEIHVEHLECIAALAALKVLIRHNLSNSTLDQHFMKQWENMMKMYASYDAKPRQLRITNPDPSNVGSGFSPRRNLRG